MNSVYSIWQIHCILFLLLGLSFVGQGIPIAPIQHPAKEPSFTSPSVPTLLELAMSSTTRTSDHRSSITSLSSSSSSSTDVPTHILPSSTSTGVLASSTSSTTTVLLSSASGTDISTSSTTSTTNHSITKATTRKSPSETATTTTSSSPSSSSSNSDKKTLIIALSVTFSVLGTIAIVLIIILLLQCTNSSPHYQRFRLRCFPFNRGGATPLSDLEIASWREKPLNPPGSEPPTYVNLIQRYSRPLSFNRPINSSQTLMIQAQPRESRRQSGFPPPGLTRPAVPPKLILSPRNGYRSEGGSGAETHERRVDSIPLGNRDKMPRSAPLPPIARAPNSRPGLTDESLPGTPAFIFPTHPRRVSRKLSKAHHHRDYPFSPQSLTSPSTPRLTDKSTTRKASNTINNRKRRRSMPTGLNARYRVEDPRSDGAHDELLRWMPRRFEEDQVVQRGSLGLSSGGEKGLGVHSRSRSDLFPFKEAMEGRSRHSPGIRPSFEESMERVKEEAPS